MKRNSSRMNTNEHGFYFWVKEGEFAVVDRALLENAFCEKPDKYFWIDDEAKLHPRRLKSFRDNIIWGVRLDDKTKEDFSKWVDWIISDEIGWDDGVYESVDRDFRIEFNVTNYYEGVSDVSVFMIGDKKYKKIMEEAWVCMKPKMEKYKKGVWLL